MTEYDFTLILQEPADLSDELLEQIYGKCDDCTVSSRYGTAYVEFCREGKDLATVITSAIRDICALGLIVRRVDVCSLVTQAEIARRADLSRQVIHNYVTGQRRLDNFPPPTCHINDDEAPLWNWCEVAAWLYKNNLVKQSALENAFVVDWINNRLDHDFLHRIDPKRTKSINRLIEKSIEQCECCE